jgi:predicted  nucleic acid-binding Zn-ribbon protein
MARWKLKGCIRCGGDLFVDRDEYGWYEGCLRCGYRGDLSIVANSKKQSTEKSREPALAASGKN